MKKSLLSIAFVAAGIFSFSALAQEPCCNPSQACCEKPAQECCKAAPQKHKGVKANPLEGINLTPEQQAAVKALNEKTAQAHKDARKAKAEAKAQERKQVKNGRQEYLNEMKKILTPEQYTQYLENLAATKGPKAKFNKEGRKGPKGEAKHSDRKDRKGPKARKSAQKAPAQTAE